MTPSCYTSAAETGQMSAVETGQMSAAETGQMSTVETRQMSKSQTGLPAAMGLVQSQARPKSWLTKVPVGAKNIKFGPKWVKNRRFGPKQGPNESYDLSGPIRTTPEAKNGQKIRRPLQSVERVRVRTYTSQINRSPNNNQKSIHLTQQLAQSNDQLNKKQPTNQLPVGALMGQPASRI